MAAVAGEVSGGEGQVGVYGGEGAIGGVCVICLVW